MDKRAKPQTQKIKVKTEGPIVFVFYALFSIFLWRSNYALSNQVTIEVLNIYIITEVGTTQLSMARSRQHAQFNCIRAVNALVMFNWAVL